MYAKLMRFLAWSDANPGRTLQDYNALVYPPQVTNEDAPIAEPTTVPVEGRLIAYGDKTEIFVHVHRIGALGHRSLHVELRVPGEPARELLALVGTESELTAFADAIIDLCGPSWR